MKARDLFPAIRTDTGLLPADLRQRIVHGEKELPGTVVLPTICVPRLRRDNVSPRPTDCRADVDPADPAGHRRTY
jgi:hypothetical protein